jgi:DNA repair ATPase RecN
MGDGCTPEMVREHERRLTEVEASTSSSHKRMDNLEEFKDLMHEMNLNVGVIAEQIKNMAGTLLRHEDAIEDIQAKMETKDTVSRLHERVDELEMKDGKEAERQLKQLKWLIISTLLVLIIGFVWSNVIG